MFTKLAFALFGLILFTAACGGSDAPDVSTDEPSTSESTESAAPDTQTETETTTTEETPAETIPAVVESTGDYTTENSRELAPICNSQSFAAGLTPTPQGNFGVAFVQDEVGGPYEYDSAAVRSTSGVFAGFTTTEIDIVACAELTAEDAFALPCDVDDVQFDLVGQTFNVSLYNVHTQEVVATTTTTHAQECPSFAVAFDGKVQAARIDPAPIEAALVALAN